MRNPVRHALRGHSFHAGRFDKTMTNNEKIAKQTQDTMNGDDTLYLEMGDVKRFVLESKGANPDDFEVSFVVRVKNED